jgi:hypothetical protein
VKEQWVDCPACFLGYWRVWEYDWDNLARCPNCKEDFIVNLPEDEDDDGEV